MLDRILEAAQIRRDEKVADADAELAAVQGAIQVLQAYSQGEDRNAAPQRPAKKRGRKKAAPGTTLTDKVLGAVTDKPTKGAVITARVMKKFPSTSRSSVSSILSQLKTRGKIRATVGSGGVLEFSKSE